MTRSVRRIFTVIQPTSRVFSARKGGERVTCVQTVFPCEMFLQLRVSDLLRTAALRQDDALLSELDQINFSGCDARVFFSPHTTERSSFFGPSKRFRERTLH